MTRPMIPFGTGFFAGLFAAFFLCVNGPLGTAGFAVLALSALLLGALSLVFKMKFRGRAMLFCAAFALAAAYSALFASFRLFPLETLNGTEAEVSGRVISYTEGDRSRVVISGTVGGIPAKAVIYAAGFSGSAGDGAELTARISKLEDTPFFRSREYYLPDGILVSGSAVGGVTTSAHGKTAIDFLREYGGSVSLNIRRNVGGEAGELLSALLTGDRTSFSDGLRLKLNRSGTAHLAAVSGLHVTVLAVFITAVFKKLRLPRGLSAAATLAFIAAFIVFSGMRVSAVRAGIMAAISAASVLVRRRTDAFNTLCVCAVAMTAFDPFAAADSSLCLSLAGTFGVSVAAPALIKALGAKGKITRAILSSLCASVLTAPFVMLWFNELSLVSPITNLAAVPLCSAALVLGMKYAATGCLFTPIIKLAGLLCGAAVKLSGAVAGLGFTYIPLGSAAVGTAAACGAAISAAVYLVTKKPRVCAVVAALCLAITMGIYGAQTVITDGNLYLGVMSRSDSSALVLRKGGECIIIDFDGKMSSESENYIERSGVRKVRAVFLLGGADAGYSAYLPLGPDGVYCLGGAYSSGEIPQTAIYDGSSAEIFGARLEFESGEVKIFTDNSSVTVKNGGAAEDGGIRISLLDGLTVIKSGESAEIYGGGLLKELEV